MMQLVRRFLRWLLALLGEQHEVAHPAQPTGPALAPQERINAPELGLGVLEPPSYRMSRSLFTDNERVLFRALTEAVGGEYRIFGKVRMSDFIWLTNEPINRKFHNNQILCKHVDFLICDREGQAPLLVIELDDGTHRKFQRKESDDFKNRTFEAIGLPILRFSVQNSYSVSQLSDMVRVAVESRRRRGS